MTSIRSIILRLTLTLLAVCLFIEPANANERRLALVIANEDYPVSIGRLNNTHEDAAEIEIALTAAGFEVTRVLDASAAEMETAIADFEIAIDAAAANGEDVIAFFYGSMHGVAADVEGQTRNFLVPANEEITSTGQLIRKGIRIDQIVAGLAATQAKGVIIVSDACRNDIGLSLTKSVGTKGFVPVQGGPGVLLAYATSQGATTPDDGLFAKTLARE
ncbi:MAG: caspase family protein, partial [Pseudomonadota bacterium]